MINRILIAICLALLVVPVFAADQETKVTTLSGKVTDNDGNPLAGAEVEAYSMSFEEQGMGMIMTLIGSVTTKEDGAFSFTAASQAGVREIAMIVAHKEGLSLGWSNHYAASGESPSLDIQLGPPHKIAGVVTNEDGKPVPDAEVRAMLFVKPSGSRHSVLYSVAPCEKGVATTDEQGRFFYSDIPEDASAEFTVRAKGYGRIATYVLSTAPGQFKAGQSDIEIELPKEGIVEGKVLDSETRRPVPDVQLVLALEPDNPFLGHTASSDAEGAFRADGLAPGRYLLKLLAAKGKEPGYVAESVMLDVEAGELKDGVILETSQGLALEVVVLEEGTKAPIGKARIHLRNPENDERFQSRTDEKGVGRFSLAAGEYVITYLYHADYATKRANERVTIAEGKPTAVTVTLKGKTKIKGKALDAEGKPVEGAVISILPMYAGRERKTDAAGEFEVLWEAQPWMEEQGIIPVILVRHVERNLATAKELEDATKPVSVTLEPAVSVVGKVMDPEGQPVPKANVRLYTRTGNMSGSIGRSGSACNEEGKYEIKAVPLDRTYTVHVNADGYGTGQCEVHAAGGDNQRIEAETITLQLANLSLAGKVVDGEDKPVANVRVTAYGSGQPQRQTTTDKDGKFSLDGVCKGELRVQANIREGGRYIRGSATAQGGATDVVVVIGEQASSGAPRPTPPRSLVGKTLPDVTGFGGDVADADLDGQRVLVCFWNMNQRPSRHTLRVLASKADLLEKEGVTVLAIHADPADLAKVKEWTRQYKVPFAVGMVEKNPEVTRKAWGVQGLPWLILADKEHMVVKEGFKVADVEAVVAGGAAAE